MCCEPSRSSSFTAIAPELTYQETIEFLYSLRWFGAKLGLENTRQLAALSGNPQDRLRFIHVAGTNGKGSTCAMLESIYREAGLRVGLFTSPHLVAFSERIQVNRVPITEQEVVDQVSAIQPLLAHFPQEHHPTFFEAVTVMALRYFAEKGCELVIWETGLGGRLDATNIVTPLISVITNIQYDHQKWLGETLPSIAREKAGIIKPGVPVVTATEAPDALQVIRETATRQDAPLIILDPAAPPARPLDRIALPLLGRHQRVNASLALAAVRLLQDVVPVSSAAIARGLGNIFWPGRLQLITRPNGQRVLLDGAHNPGGAATLAEALTHEFSAQKPVLILGILRDKDWMAMCEILAPLASRILLTPVHSERTAEPHGLAEACARANPKAPVLECASLSDALAAAADDPFVAIAGSLYLIGEALEILHVSPARAVPERGLNEYGLGGVAAGVKRVN